MQNNVNTNISWYEGHTIKSLGKILNFSKFYVQNIWQVVRRWHHQLTHLHIIDWSRNVLWKFAKTWKCHNFLIFQPIFIRFSLFCLKFFTLYSEINSNLFQITPLKTTCLPGWYRSKVYAHLMAHAFGTRLLLYVVSFQALTQTQWLYHSSVWTCGMQVAWKSLIKYACILLFKIRCSVGLVWA